ncbi:hypothetical protein [Mesorhizobium sp. M0520]|uniref:hypothetical protein n=1 Tax=Mesorhizobium sp. M0520 TaxID=2956957 RepID=UPI00333BB259
MTSCAFIAHNLQQRHCLLGSERSVDRAEVAGSSEVSIILPQSSVLCQLSVWFGAIVAKALCQIQRLPDLIHKTECSPRDMKNAI